MNFDVEIVSKKENKLLNRNEVAVVVGFPAQTPSRKDLRAAIAGKIAANPDFLTLISVTNEFGIKRIKVLAHSYSNGDLMKKNELNYVLVRDGLAEKKPKKKKEKKTTARARKEPK